MNKLNAGFFELYEGPAQPVSAPDDLSARQFRHGRLNPTWLTPKSGRTAVSPLGSYPWEETERALAALGDDVEDSTAEGIQLEYSNPWTGGPVLPTIACRIARLRAGYSGLPRQHDLPRRVRLRPNNRGRGSARLD